MRLVVAAIAASLCIVMTPARGVQAASPSVTFKPPTISVNPGESFTVDVVVNTDTPIRGAQFGLRYDSSVVQIDKVSDGTFLPNWARGAGAQALTAIPFKINNSAGLLSVGGISVLGGTPGQAGATGSGSLLTLEMSAKPGIRGATYLAFVNLYVSGGAGSDATTLPLVLGSPGLIGVATDPSSLQAHTPLEYRPPIAPSTYIDAHGSSAVQPTQQPIQDGILEQPQVRFADTAVAAAASPTPLPPTVTPVRLVPTSTLPPVVVPTAPAAVVTTATPPPTPASATQPTLAAVATSAPPRPQQQQPLASPLPQSNPAAFQQLAQTGPSQPLASGAATVIVSTPRPLAAAAPIIKPRGSTGFFIPWELVAAVGGAVVALGAVLFAIRQRKPSSGA